MSRSLLITGLCFAFVPLGAQAAGSFDGTYRGSQTTLRSNNSPSCANMDRDNVVLRITNNHFSRAWGRNNNGGDTVEVDVAPDGTFKGTVTALSNRTNRYGVRSYDINGRIAGAELTAEFGSNICAVKMTLHKS
jgi:hypothetical protein